MRVQTRGPVALFTVPKDSGHTRALCNYMRALCTHMNEAEPWAMS